MKVILLVAIALAAVNAKAVHQRQQVLNLDVDQLFSEFKTNFGKVYASETEEAQRLDAFRSNLAFIAKHNAEFEKGVHTYTVGVNQFADLTNAEWRALRQKSMYNSSRPRDEAWLPESPEDTVDWRTKGAVTPVKNQGQCGSCWSFSTTGSVEGQHALATGNLVSLSEQNLVDCSGPEGNDGCNGGLMTQAFEYIIKNNGIDTEASYPYKAVEGKCKFTTANVGATISSYASVQSGSEAALQNASATIGPISIAMDAGLNSFQLYTSGIYDPLLCSSTQLDHGVLVVGYGTESSQDYWIVKNSWGTSWGMEGYFLLARNANNKCGVATMASYPIV